MTIISLIIIIVIIILLIIIIIIIVSVRDPGTQSPATFRFSSSSSWTTPLLHNDKVTQKYKKNTKIQK